MAFGLGGLGFGGLGFGGLGYGGFGNQSFVCQLSRYIGQTVTIFTTSGGVSGCGYTGILLSVNCNFVRISTRQGTPPANPLSSVICGGYGYGCNNFNYGNDYGMGGGYGSGCYHGIPFNLGSVCDIPLCKIVSFCHTAV